MHPRLTERTRYVLHELLQPAYEKIDRTYWPARLASAELLLSKYNKNEAKADFAAARSLNNNLPDAYVGLGRLALDGWDFDTAERHVQTALQTNPNHVGAMQLLAEVRMTERKYREAAAEVDKALDINPNDPRTLSLAAAAHLRMGEHEKSEAFQQRVAAINPNYGQLHLILADWLAAARQFPEAETHYRKAITLDPEDARPRAQLGLTYMQWGKEAEARAVLDESWALDPFNDETYNTLELLDRLEGFDRYGSDHFVIHYNADPDAVLAPYFAEYLESVYDELCEDFDHEPADKTIIEIFPGHDQFAVRITGKPWIHTIGASTGRVIALDAPRRDAAGEPFNWERVLRHEFVHTVTLAATRNRIPHWFTEGLAVLQENAPRSYRWQRKLAERVQRDQLFTLESIDWGFTRPRRRDDREMAYAQSEWMCEYLIGRFGYGVINRMIVAFREDQTQDEVFRGVVKIEPERFSEEFKAWAVDQIREWGFRTDPIESALKLKALLLLNGKDAALHGRLARTLLADEDYDGAHQAAEKALELDGDNVDALEVMSLLLIAAAEQLEGDDRQRTYDKLEPLLTRLAEADPSSPTPAESFGRIALARDNLDDAVRWFERLKRLRPSHPVAYQALAAIYLQRDQPDKALPALINLWRSDENDPDLPLRIAKLFEARGDRQADAMQWYRRSIAIDPYDAEPHQALARLSAAAGRWSDAVREYRALCTLEPAEAEHHTQLALAYEKAGDLTKARAAAEQAVKRDPDSPAAKLLTEDKPQPGA
jgi:Flp pilus assembly protein TadD